MNDVKESMPHRRRPIRRNNISIENLYLDPMNPRLPASVQGGKQLELLTVLLNQFNLSALVDSLSTNGYFTEEPLVCIPTQLPDNLQKRIREYSPEEADEFGKLVLDDSTEFTVVEGNRRLATCRLLIDDTLRKTLGVSGWPKLNADISSDLRGLPGIVYPTRAEVVPYLGVRHITGIQKWDSYAKARYIANVVSGGTPLSEVEQQIGDSRSSVRKNYIAFKMLEQLEHEFDIDTSVATRDFSLLVLALGQGKIKQFIGLPKKISEANESAPVPEMNLNNLRDLVSWLFGDKKYKEVIRESRDITKMLTHVVGNDLSVKHLRATRNLEEAYDRSDGEEIMLLKYITGATGKLETALGIAHLHSTADVQQAAERCAKTANQLLRNVTPEDD